MIMLLMAHPRCWRFGSQVSRFFFPASSQTLAIKSSFEEIGRHLFALTHIYYGLFISETPAVLSVKLQDCERSCEPFRSRDLLSFLRSSPCPFWCCKAPIISLIHSCNSKISQPRHAYVPVLFGSYSRCIFDWGSTF